MAFPGAGAGFFAPVAVEVNSSSTIWVTFTSSSAHTTPPVPASRMILRLRSRPIFSTDDRVLSRAEWDAAAALQAELAELGYVSDEASR